MDRGCADCRQLRSEIDEKALRVDKLEKELALCQNYLRKQTERIEAATRKFEITGDAQKRKCEFLEAEKLEIIAKNQVLERQLESQTEQSIQVMEHSEKTESEYLRKILDLEDEVKELKDRQNHQNTRNLEPSLVAELEHRLQLLEAVTGGASNASTTPECSYTAYDPDFYPETTLLDRKLELEVTQAQLQEKENDPLAIAEELSRMVFEKFTNESEMRDAADRMIRFEMEFKAYQHQMEMAAKTLSTTNSHHSFHSDPLPTFPDPFDLAYMKMYETAMKAQKPNSTSRKPDAECLICNTGFSDRVQSANCVGCGTRYHEDCGRIFADQNLTCLQKNCYKKFKDTNWF